MGTGKYSRFTALNVGRTCKFFRDMRLGKTQADVAREVGVSREIINKFECGRFVNYKILFWYIDKGLFKFLPIDSWDFYDTTLGADE